MALGNQRKMLIRQPLGAGPALGALVLGLSPPLSLRFCPAGLGRVSRSAAACAWALFRP